jgi:hypothetical protein
MKPQIDREKIALPLLPVRVTSVETGRQIDTFALLDSGASLTLCNDELREALGVTGQPHKVTLATVDQTRAPIETIAISLRVTDLTGNGEVNLDKVYSIPDLNLSRDHMATKEEVSQWSHLRDLPIRYASMGNVTLLIGQDNPEALFPLTTVTGAPGDPYALQTRLGWTVSGPVSHKRNTTAAFYTSHEETAKAGCCYRTESIERSSTSPG